LVRGHADAPLKLNKVKYFTLNSLIFNALRRQRCVRQRLKSGFGTALTTL